MRSTSGKSDHNSVESKGKFGGKKRTRDQILWDNVRLESIGDNFGGFHTPDGEVKDELSDDEFLARVILKPFEDDHERIYIKNQRITLICTRRCFITHVAVKLDEFGKYALGKIESINTMDSTNIFKRSIALAQARPTEVLHSWHNVTLAEAYKEFNKGEKLEIVFEKAKFFARSTPTLKIMVLGLRKKPNLQANPHSKLPANLYKGLLLFPQPASTYFIKVRGKFVQRWKDSTYPDMDYVVLLISHTNEDESTEVLKELREISFSRPTSDIRFFYSANAAASSHLLSYDDVKEGKLLLLYVANLNKEREPRTHNSYTICFRSTPTEDSDGRPVANSYTAMENFIALCSNRKRWGEVKPYWHRSFYMFRIADSSVLSISRKDLIHLDSQISTKRVKVLEEPDCILVAASQNRLSRMLAKCLHALEFGGKVVNLDLDTNDPYNPPGVVWFDHKKAAPYILWLKKGKLHCNLILDINSRAAIEGNFRALAAHTAVLIARAQNNLPLILPNIVQPTMKASFVGSFFGKESEEWRQALAEFAKEIREQAESKNENSAIDLGFFFLDRELAIELKLVNLYSKKKNLLVIHSKGARFVKKLVNITPQVKIIRDFHYAWKENKIDCSYRSAKITSLPRWIEQKTYTDMTGVTYVTNTMIKDVLARSLKAGFFCMVIGHTTAKTNNAYLMAQTLSLAFRRCPWDLGNNSKDLLEQPGLPVHVMVIDLDKNDPIPEYFPPNRRVRGGLRAALVIRDGNELKFGEKVVILEAPETQNLTGTIPYFCSPATRKGWFRQALKYLYPNLNSTRLSIGLKAAVNRNDCKIESLSHSTFWRHSVSVNYSHHHHSSWLMNRMTNTRWELTHVSVDSKEPITDLFSDIRVKVVGSSKGEKITKMFSLTWEKIRESIHRFDANRFFIDLEGTIVLYAGSEETGVGEPDFKKPIKTFDSRASISTEEIFSDPCLAKYDDLFIEYCQTTGLYSSQYALPEPVESIQRVEFMLQAKPNRGREILRSYTCRIFGRKMQDVEANAVTQKRKKFLAPTLETMRAFRSCNGENLVSPTLRGLSFYTPTLHARCADVAKKVVILEINEQTLCTPMGINIVCAFAEASNRILSRHEDDHSDDSHPSHEKAARVIDEVSAMASIAKQGPLKAVDKVNAMASIAKQGSRKAVASLSQAHIDVDCESVPSELKADEDCESVPSELKADEDESPENGRGNFTFGDSMRATAKKGEDEKNDAVNPRESIATADAIKGKNEVDIELGGMEVKVISEVPMNLSAKVEEGKTKFKERANDQCRQTEEKFTMEFKERANDQLRQTGDKFTMEFKEKLTSSMRNLMGSFTRRSEAKIFPVVNEKPNIAEARRSLLNNRSMSFFSLAQAKKDAQNYKAHDTLFLLKLTKKEQQDNRCRIQLIQADEHSYFYPRRSQTGSLVKEMIRFCDLPQLTSSGYRVSRIINSELKFFLIDQSSLRRLVLGKTENVLLCLHDNGEYSKFVIKVVMGMSDLLRRNNVHTVLMNLEENSIPRYLERIATDSCRLFVPQWGDDSGFNSGLPPFLFLCDGADAADVAFLQYPLDASGQAKHKTDEGLILEFLRRNLGFLETKISQRRRGTKEGLLASVFDRTRLQMCYSLNDYLTGQGEDSSNDIRSQLFSVLETPEAINSLKILSRKFDPDKNGELDKDELAGCLTMVMSNPFTHTISKPDIYVIRCLREGALPEEKRDDIELVEVIAQVCQWYDVDTDARHRLKDEESSKILATLIFIIVGRLMLKEKFQENSFFFIKALLGRFQELSVRQSLIYHDLNLGFFYFVTQMLLLSLSPVYMPIVCIYSLWQEDTTIKNSKNDGFNHSFCAKIMWSIFMSIYGWGALALFITFMLVRADVINNVNISAIECLTALITVVITYWQLAPGLILNLLQRSVSEEKPLPCFIGFIVAALSDREEALTEDRVNKLVGLYVSNFSVTYRRSVDGNDENLFDGEVKIDILDKCFKFLFVCAELCKSTARHEQLADADEDEDSDDSEESEEENEEEEDEDLGPASGGKGAIISTKQKTYGAEVWRTKLSVITLIGEFEAMMKQRHEQTRITSSESCGGRIGNALYNPRVLYVIGLSTALVHYLMATLVSISNLQSNDKINWSYQAVVYIILGINVLFGLSFIYFALNIWIILALKTIIHFVAVASLPSPGKSSREGLDFSIRLSSASNLVSWLKIRQEIFDVNLERLAKLFPMDRIFPGLISIAGSLACYNVFTTIQGGENEYAAVFYYQTGVLTAYVVGVLSLYAQVNAVMNDNVLDFLHAEKLNVGFACDPSNNRAKKLLANVAKGQGAFQNAMDIKQRIDSGAGQKIVEGRINDLVKDQNYLEDLKFPDAHNLDRASELGAHVSKPNVGGLMSNTFPNGKVEIVASPSQVGNIGVAIQCIDGAITRISNPEFDALQLKVFGRPVTFKGLIAVGTSYISSFILAIGSYFARQSGQF
eukprot:jgi/Bigna1/147351/aug1.142_g22059